MREVAAMPLIMFSKFFNDRDTKGLIDLAHSLGLDGYDLCVRPEYMVNPDNVSEMLPKVTAQFKSEGLQIPMVTGNFDLLESTHPTAEPILDAMDKSDIRFLKLGYFILDPARDYWEQVDKVRSIFEGWTHLSRRYGVKICYHTHSVRCMGLNCSSLMHLLRGFDPKCLGAYVDTAHLLIEGEEFAVGLAMAKEYLSLIALKDVLLERIQINDHGSVDIKWVCAGEGMVNWTGVAQSISESGFSGPVSIHCEFEVSPDRFEESVHREVAFFKELLNK